MYYVYVRFYFYIDGSSFFLLLLLLIIIFSCIQHQRDIAFTHVYIAANIFSTLSNNGHRLHFKPPSWSENSSSPSLDLDILFLTSGCSEFLPPPPPLSPLSLSLFPSSPSASTYYFLLTTAYTNITSLF